MDEMTYLDASSVELPGEVVIGLMPEVGQGLGGSVASGPSRGAPSGVTNFGEPSLDQVLSKLKVVEVRKVHGPLPPAPRGVMADEIDASLGSTYRVRFDAATKVSTAVDRLNALDTVAFAEPVMLREAFVVPNDPRYPQQWGLAKIRCPEAWDRTTGDPAIVVAVVDTGVDLDHPELAPLLLPGQDLVDLGPNPGPPMAGWVWEGDFNGRDNIAQDEVGHGTHVAGTIACVSNEGSGVAGVTWNCRLLPVKVLNRARRLSDNRISGFGTSVDIAAGIRWAADHGARVINMSLGGPGNDQVTANAVAYANSRGCVVIAAMGNTGNSVPQFPAALPDVLAVGAVDSNDVRASFSSMGPHIGVAAPGVGILSTVWDNTHSTMQGTSMASPHVAGVAALMLSCKGSLSPAQVRQAIIDTARPLRDQASDPVPNDRYGAGLVDARAALDRVCPPKPSRQIVVCQQSQIIVCKPTTLIACRPSRVVVCESVQILCQPVSRTIVCQPSQLVACQPSRVVTCQPSLAISCAPSLTVTCDFPSQRLCPSTAVCGPGLPIRPVLDADPYLDDPYGTDYGDDR